MAFVLDFSCLLSINPSKGASKLRSLVGSVENTPAHVSASSNCVAVQVVDW